MATERPKRGRGSSSFRAGLLTLVVITVACYFAFTRANPLADKYELEAVFESANNLKPRSPVRTAGVAVGKVTAVEPISDGDGGARVHMEIEDRGLPVHEDAELKIRPRIFLEGNFFVDLQPGSPSAPELDDGATVPLTQTEAPVQFGDVLAALESDTRADLQEFLEEYSRGLEGRGATGFRESIRYWRDAYRSSAIANEATLGLEPQDDLGRLLRGQQRTAAGLARDERALKALVANFDVTAAAFARRDAELEASVPALRDTLEAAEPALASLNSALPSLRAFARTALPGVRSSTPALEASLPFLRQARRLVSPPELQAAARSLRRYVPDLVELVAQSVAISEEGRQLSACTNQVLVPFTNLRIPDPDFAANSDQKALWQIQRSFPGLAGESRLADGQTQYYHATAVPPGDRVRPAPPPDGGSEPPPHRPDVPCENQELPSLEAPGATPEELTYTPTPGASYVRGGPRISKARFDAAVARAAAAWPAVERAIARDQLRNLRYFRELGE